MFSCLSDDNLYNSLLSLVVSQLWHHTKTIAVTPITQTLRNCEPNNLFYIVLPFQEND